MKKKTTSTTSGDKGTPSKPEKIILDTNTQSLSGKRGKVMPD
jgi:hypothetical protein